MAAAQRQSGKKRERSHGKHQQHVLRERLAESICHGIADFLSALSTVTAAWSWQLKLSLYHCVLCRDGHS